MDQTRGLRLIVVMPVFRDWEAAALLCQRLDQQFRRVPTVQATVLLVDDGSSNGREGWVPFEPCSIGRIEALRLRRNLGHQRAIALGLCHVHDTCDCDAVLVMDSDGEDRPEDAVKLVLRLLDEPDAIVFAERRKRLEGLIFRTGYVLYRWVHRGLTGVSVRVGNFSILPFAALARLVTMSELWNHYSGAVYKSKLQHQRVPMDRGRRLAGRSHMDVVSLVMHGVAGIATFHDVVATRILLASVGGVASVALALAFVVAIQIGTGGGIVGWPTLTVGVLLLLLVQLGSVAFSLVLSLIAGRLTMPFVPIRDYKVFIHGLEELSITVAREDGTW